MVTNQQKQRMRELIQEGKSGNYIQNQLQKEGIGIRRTEIYNYRAKLLQQPISKEKKIVSTPIKYLSEEKKKEKKVIIEKREKRKKEHILNLQKIEKQVKKEENKKLVDKLQKLFHRDKKWVTGYIDKSKKTVKQLKQYTTLELINEMRNISP